MLLEDANGALETETKKLLQGLELLDLDYDELEQLYFSDIVEGKDSSFYRQLLIRGYRDKIPLLRVNLLKLYQVSEASIRSRIKDELPFIQQPFHIFHIFRFISPYMSLVSMPTF